MKKQLTTTLFFLLFYTFQIKAQIFVKHDASGTNDGSFFLLKNSTLSFPLSLYIETPTHHQTNLDA